jgi:polygalacturonase
MKVYGMARKGVRSSTFKTIFSLVTLVVAVFANGAEFDVRLFGAAGDGTTKDTASIQKAIDTAHASGGGKVVFGKGIYLSGTVFLKSFVELKFEEGAILKGSPDKEDYCKADAFAQNYASVYDNMSGGHLIVAKESTSISLLGPGKIDGNSSAFLLDKNGKQYSNWKKGIPWRPGQMVFIVDCKDVFIDGVEMVNSPYWTCFLLNNNDVTVRNCRIRSERRKFKTWTGDGLDIDRCQNVMVTGCDIETEDDSITLRASLANKLKHPQDCCNVTVSNCVLSSACNAVRVGVGQGVVRDCRLFNLDIRDTLNAVNIISSYTPNKRGTDIHDITFKSIKADCERFLVLEYGRGNGWAKEAVIRDIVFKDISAKAKKENSIREEPGRSFKNIIFKNCDITLGR